MLHEKLCEILQKPQKLLANSREVSAPRSILCSIFWQESMRNTALNTALNLNTAKKGKIPVGRTG